MPLKKLLSIFSFFFLSGCLHPQKPVVEVCIPDIMSMESICGISNQGIATNVIRFPISKIHSATCFPPQEWKKYKDYVDLLEAYIDSIEKQSK